MSFSLLSHDGVAGAEALLDKTNFALSHPDLAIEKNQKLVFLISNGQNNRASIDRAWFFCKKSGFLY